MSILLIDPPADVGEAVVTRLIRAGDQVRIIERNAPRASLWTRLGAHVARGDPNDDDLVERAATDCRTIVTFTDDDARLATASRAARAARVERMIAVVQRERDVPADIEVIMLVARAKGLLRKGTPVEALAAAVDAADDVVTIPSKPLDLNDVDAWTTLGLPKP